jgi:hypothetical protein
VIEGPLDLGNDACLVRRLDVDGKRGRRPSAKASTTRQCFDQDRNLHDGLHNSVIAILAGAAAGEQLTDMLSQDGDEPNSRRPAHLVV